MANRAAAVHLLEMMHSVQQKPALAAWRTTRPTSHHQERSFCPARAAFRARSATPCAAFPQSNSSRSVLPTSPAPKSAESVSQEATAKPPSSTFATPSSRPAATLPVFTYTDLLAAVGPLLQDAGLHPIPSCTAALQDGGSGEGEDTKGPAVGDLNGWHEASSPSSSHLLQSSSHSAVLSRSGSVAVCARVLEALRQNRALLLVDVPGLTERRWVQCMGPCTDGDCPSGRLGMEMATFIRAHKHCKYDLHGFFMCIDVNQLCCLNTAASAQRGRAMAHIERA